MKKNQRRRPALEPEIVSLNEPLFSLAPGLQALDDLDDRLALAVATQAAFACDTFTCTSFSGSCGAFSCGSFKVKPG
jgi:hypothetical protein